METIIAILRLSAQVLFPVTAHAAGLADVGAFTAGMWTQACAILPYCGAGAGGLVIATGIVINAVLFTIGSAAVVIILYAAIRLVTSAGNEEIVRKAWKETILYACLGLIFTVLADTIVNYVIGLVSGIASS